VKFRENLPLILAGVALGLAAVQTIHPIGFHAHPVLMFAVALLLGLRWVLRKSQRRALPVEKVSEHPLGISDDPDK
jgi:hypothetical protein